MKIKKLILVGVLLAALLCGTSVAYMFKVTSQENNSFIPATVSCRVEEEFDGEVKTDIQIENTSNIPVYLRLRLVTYWVNTDSEGKEYIASKPSASLDSVQYESNLWLKGDDNTYYYTQIVNESDGVSNQHFTQNLLTAPIVLSEDDEGYRQVVEVFAEAIQAEPAKAVESAWPVKIDAETGCISLK